MKDLPICMIILEPLLLSKDTIMQQDIGFRIKQAIGMTGYSMREFSRISNISRGTLSNWMYTKKSISEKSVHRLKSELEKLNVIIDIEWIKDSSGAPPHYKV